MEDIKKTLAVAITAAGVTAAAQSPALAQDVSASERDSDQDKIVQLAYNDADSGQYIKASQKSSADSDVPKSKIKFRRARLGGKIVEITPDLVKKFAAKGQVKMPKAREENVVPYRGSKHERGFLSYLNRGNGKAGIVIGVVVKNEPYSPLLSDNRDHFRSVHKRVAEIMTGRKFDGSGAKTKGLAELYGAEVSDIVPISFNNDSYKMEGVNIKGLKTIKLQVNDILIAINDNFYLVEYNDNKDGFELINTVDRMEERLKYALGEDRHLYIRDEFIANKEEIVSAALSKYGRVNPYMMFTKDWDEFLAKNEKGHSSRSSVSRSGKSEGSGDSDTDITPDIAALSHD